MNSLVDIEKVDRQRFVFRPKRNRLFKREQMVVNQVTNLTREVEESDHVVCENCNFDGSW